MKQVDKLYLQANELVFSTIGILVNTVISGSLAALIVSVIGIEWIVWQILAIIVMAQAISFGLYSLSIVAIMMKNHDPDIDPEEEIGDLGFEEDGDSEEGTYARLVEMTIGEKSEPVGKFNGDDIFEWVDLTGSQGTARYEYFGTIRDGEDMHWVPSGSIILPPGVIYIPKKDA